MAAGTRVTWRNFWDNTNLWCVLSESTVERGFALECDKNLAASAFRSEQRPRWKTGFAAFLQSFCPAIIIQQFLQRNYKQTVYWRLSTE